MNWQTENAKDVTLLSKLDLTPLSPRGLTDSGDLFAMIEVHNARMARIPTRIQDMGTARRRLANFDVWVEIDGTDIALERARVSREAWDAMLELHRVFAERHAILQRMEGPLVERYRHADDKYHAVVTATEKRMHKDWERLLRDVPYSCGERFANLVAEDKKVEEATTLRRTTSEDCEAVAAAKRRALSDQTQVTTRQKEVLSTLAG